ncbi:hypothetical protein ACYZT9_14015 [Pseudomonas sp. ZT5P21]
MSRSALGKALLGFAVVATVAIVAIADVFNATHLFNPDWPGHARFHIGMQFTTLVLVSLFSLAALRRGQVWAAALAPASFWPGLFVAFLIPGTDVYASEALRELGVPINLLLAAVLLGITGLGIALQASKERRPS